ncbi:MAG: DEAD/DEAH box helicase [Bacteroidetes bacterium]|nr:DEAD/DEAH box helicase [Bacteroidota bacterium]
MVKFKQLHTRKRLITLLQSLQSSELSLPHPLPPRTYHVELDATIQITEEFKQLTSILESTSKHAFITGKAGTGKSTLLQYFRSKTGKRVVVLAPTGIAAVNIGGSTIHSFFKFPQHFLTEDDIKVKEQAKALYRAIDVLLIDEISMVRPDLLDAIDLFLRKHREIMNRPFGGVQVAFFGDLFQLPPVIDSSLEEFYHCFYATPYFFSANIINNVSIQTYELQTVFRQSDPTFIEILNRIRTNTFTKEDLAYINERVYPRSHNPFGTANYITLTSTHAIASQINKNCIASLPGQEYIYRAEISGDFPKRMYPTDEYLVLKRGAQVIMLRNDPEKRWTNGTIATVQRLSTSSIFISIDNEEYDVEPVTWERINYTFDERGKTIIPTVVGTFRQYPMMLAWAMTIHKSQGKTFNRVAIDFGWGAFAHGQAYVALSRCTSLDGICLRTPIRSEDIIVDDRIVEFLSSSQQPLNTFRLR